MAEETTKSTTPPYVPYKTFTNFINGLGETGIPAQIDPSMMTSMSGSVQSALIRSLEYLKLIEKGGKPAAGLTQLVESEEKQRGPILRSVLEAAYPFMFSGAVDLKRATTKQVEEAFRAQGAQGSTTVKCIAFFLAAAKASGITISAHVKTPAAQRSSPVPKRGNAGNSAGNTPEPDVEREPLIPPDSQQLRLPVPGKGEVLVIFPKDFGKQDWLFLKPIFDAYVGKLFDNDL